MVDLALLKKNIASFDPGRSVRILAADTPLPLRVWELARLMGWAALDQAPGLKFDVRSNYAKRAGIAILGYRLDRLRKREKLHEEGELVIQLISAAGGFAQMANGPGARALLARAKKSTRDLSYVFSTVDLLCRHDADRQPQEISDLKAVWQVIVRLEERERSRTREGEKCDDEKSSGENPDSLSLIEKIWLRYKAAAPYIYAFGAEFGSIDFRTLKVRALVDLIEQLAMDRAKLLHVLGVAAYAADLLKTKKAKHVRVADLEGIPLVRPQLLPVLEEERSIIKSIDRKASIKAPRYRPKRKIAQRMRA